MFQLRQCGPTRGDCTAPYEVYLDGTYTVRTFIADVLRNDKEWGTIGIYDRHSIFGSPKCEYRYGNLLSTLPDDVLDKHVLSVEADGGWSYMAYIIKIVEEK